MTLCTANFDKGVHGNDITSATAEGDATPWDEVYKSGSFWIKYDNTYSVNGGMAAWMGRSDAGGSALRWYGSSTGSQTDSYCRAYIRPSAALDAGQAEFGFQDDAMTFNMYKISLIASDGKFQIDDRYSQQARSTVTYNAGAWQRLEWHHVFNNNGQYGDSIELRIFLNPNSTTPTETVSMTACGFQAAPARFSFGWPNIGQTVWYDAVAVGATDWLGPVGQYAYPDADSNIGSWTDQSGGTANLYATIDESPASTADYIKSPVSPSNSGNRYRLSDINDPNSSSGHEIYWTAGKTVSGGDTINMTVKLYQGGGNTLGGGTQIGSWARNDVSTFADYMETLSSGEADSITNYSDLYIEFWATTA